MKRTLLSVIFFAPLLMSFGQSNEIDVTKLTLDECIETALGQSISLKQAQNDKIVAESNKMQAIMNFFPSLSAGASYSWYYGTYFDNNLAKQISTATKTSSPYLYSSLVLFNGFSNHYLLKQRSSELNAANENIESSMQQVESNIIGLYLSVILDKENIKVAQESTDLLEAQLDREKKRESVGVGSLESVLNFQGQLANQRLTLNNLKVTLQRDKLALLQAMQMPIGEITYEIESYDIDESQLLLTEEPFESILQEVVDNNPSLKAARWSVESAKYQLRSSQAQLLPVVELEGQLGSSYSSNGATNPNSGFFESDASFRDQMDYNEYQYVGLSLTVPIFRRYSTRNSIQKAKVNMANSELDADQALTNVTNVVQTAYLDLISAQNTYLAAKENLSALSQTFEFMKKRFEAGSTDFYTYLESLNSKNNAELQLVNAKYSIIFRQKILALYRGSESAVD